MREEFKRSLTLLLVMALTLATFSRATPVGAQGTPQVKVYIDVEDNGNATVTIVFRAAGRASFSFTLPKFENYSVCSSYGNYRIEDKPSSAYFYYNSTLELAPGDNGTSTLSVCYKFPYASLLSDNQGWFMSPMLVASPPVEIEVSVRIPNLASVTLESPRMIRLEGAGYRVYRLSPGAQQLIPGRVVIEYRTAGLVQTANFSRTGEAVLTVVSPVYYRSLSEKILDVASKAYERLRNLTGVTADQVTFELYLPMESMGGISALGFVMGEDINAGGRGPIMLNLALIRYAPGYLETTVIHEMVHVFLGKAGVEANAQTRWFHEGLAQYLSIVVAQEIGVDVSDYAEELLNASSALYEYTSGNFSFIQIWPADPNLVGDAYLASFYIVYNVSSSFGGENYIARLFAAIRSRGSVKTTNDIVSVMSAAAGSNLAPLFRRFGFTGVQDWVQQNNNAAKASGNVRQSSFSLIVLLISLLIALITYIVNNRVQREIEVAKGRSVFEEKEDAYSFKTYSTFVT